MLGLAPLPQGLMGGSYGGMQCIHHAIVRMRSEAMFDLLAQACAWADLCVVCKHRERAMCDYSASAQVTIESCSRDNRAPAEKHTD